MQAEVSSVRVLLLDAHPEDASTLSQWLTSAERPSVELVTADRLDQALGIIASAPPDIILVDPALPGLDPREVLDRLVQASHSAPLMTLTSTDDTAFADRCLQAGAQDCLVKNRINPRALSRCLRYAIWRRQAAETLHRTEEQLRQAQKMEIIGRLAGGVAHDFNNLLTVIIGYSELLLTTLPPGDARKPQIEAIATAGRQGTVVTRQLLAFSRKQDVRPVDVNLNDAIRRSESVLRRLIGEDVKLTTRFDDRLGLARVDPGQMEQVLLNLAVNARDAMVGGGALFIETANIEFGPDYVTTHVDARPGAHIMLSVTDTGCGMSPEVLSHLFEPYFTTKERGKGTGLGLSTVYGIVKQSGGHLSVSSEVGRGTTFHVFLPRVQPGAGPQPSSHIYSGARGGVETIMVVEDEDSVRALLCGVLKASGYTVLEARDGAEALHLARTHEQPIHLVATDAVMPRMNGLELARTLKQMKPRTRILFLSGYPEQAPTPDQTPVDGWEHMMKPFSPDRLKLKIREMLDRGNVTDRR